LPKSVKIARLILGTEFDIKTWWKLTREENIRNGKAKVVDDL